MFVFAYENYTHGHFCFSYKSWHFWRAIMDNRFQIELEPLIVDKRFMI